MTNTSIELLNAHACFGGAQRFYQHASREIGLPMKFSVYLPPQALHGNKVPALVYLAGLTCNEETFMTKAGAQRMAAELGLALVAPDTSPRGANVPGESEAWDFGVGAGFYLDATEAPWEPHWRMESYLTRELLPLLGQKLPIDLERIGIFGHSMGGQAAIKFASKYPEKLDKLILIAPAGIEESVISPKVMLITQNHFGSQWVLVTNLAYNKIGTDFASIDYIVTITRGFNKKWSGFIENQGYNSDFYSDGIFRLGAAYLFNNHMQIDASVGKNYKNTPSLMNAGLGFSWRFADKYKEVKIAKDKSSKMDKKKKAQAEKEEKKRKDAVGE